MPEKQTFTFSTAKEGALNKRKTVSEITSKRSAFNPDILEKPLFQDFFAINGTDANSIKISVLIWTRAWDSNQAAVFLRII